LWIVCTTAHNAQRQNHATPTREWFAEQGAEPVTDSSEAFAAYIKADYDRWGPVIRDAGIKAD
jgi:tripartite-type tricarboxylate transporter receptor subunit TctC